MACFILSIIFLCRISIEELQIEPYNTFFPSWLMHETNESFLSPIIRSYDSPLQLIHFVVKEFWC